MKSAVAVCLIPLLWASVLASVSAEDESASNESGDIISSEKPPGDSDGNNEPSSNNDSDEGVDRHIVKGWPVKIKEVPFQCLLLYDNRLCGCAIISPNWVVTAAHCVFPVVRGEVAVVVAGMTELESLQDPSKIVMRFVFANDIIVHSGYNSSNIFSSDIALLKITFPFPIQETVKPIQMTSDVSVPHRLRKQLVYATGWGVSEYSGGYASAILLMGRMLVMPPKLCRVIYGETDRILCTFSSPSTTCSGDSGGPVFMYGRNKEPILVGIVSFGDKYCSVTSPAGNTYLGAYRTWIRNVTSI